MLRISLDLCLHASHNDSAFSKALSEKEFEFILCSRDGIIIFNLGLVLLPVEIDSIPKK